MGRVKIICLIVGRLLLTVPVLLVWGLFSVVFALGWGLLGLVRRVL